MKPIELRLYNKLNLILLGTYKNIKEKKLEKIIDNLVAHKLYGTELVVNSKDIHGMLDWLYSKSEAERRLILNKAYGITLEYINSSRTILNLIEDFHYINSCKECDNGETCNLNKVRIHCNVHNKSFDSNDTCAEHSINNIINKFEVMSRNHVTKKKPSKLVWSIDKQFDFCFGHRVWSQELNTEYSLDGCLACRHLHGHQGKIKVFLTSTGLKKGMVTDFKHLNWFKNWVDEALDHKFIIDLNDPLFNHECELLLGEDSVDYDKLIELPDGYWVPNMDSINKALDNMDTGVDEKRAIFEKYEGLVLVDFVPTSEKLCEWWLKVAFKKMIKIGVEVTALEYWETPKSHTRIERSNFINLEHGHILLSNDPDLLLNELDILEPFHTVNYDPDLMVETSVKKFEIRFGRFEVALCDAGNGICEVIGVKK